MAHREFERLEAFIKAAEREPDIDRAFMNYFRGSRGYVDWSSAYLRALRDYVSSLPEPSEVMMSGINWLLFLMPLLSERVLEDKGKR